LKARPVLVLEKIGPPKVKLCSSKIA